MAFPGLNIIACGMLCEVSNRGRPGARMEEATRQVVGADQWAIVAWTFFA